MNIWTLLPHVSYSSITTMTHCLYSPTQGFVAYIFLNECDFFKWMIIHILSSNVIYPKTTIYSREMYVFLNFIKAIRCYLPICLFLNILPTYCLISGEGAMPKRYSKVEFFSYLFANFWKLFYEDARWQSECFRFPLLKPLSLGLSGRFWRHASLPQLQ